MICIAYLLHCFASGRAPRAHTLGQLSEKLGLDLAAGNFTALGYLVVGIFVSSWPASLVLYRAMGYHKIGSA